MSSPFDELFGRRRASSWFPDLDSMMKEMEKLMEDALKNMEQQVPKHLVKERRLDDGSVVRETGPIVYGYSVKIGEDGKPVVRKFGNLNAFPGPLGGTFSVSDQREPIVDIIKDSDRIRVVAEIPGVNKEDLRVTASEDSVTIESISGERRYHKKMDLPYQIDPTTGKSTYKNGILEVTFNTKNPKEYGVAVSVD
jgi:HSP20 family protein